MSDIKRVLAEIVEIPELKAIENADALEVVSVRGWNVVVQKGLYQTGELAVYFSIDALLPEYPEFEWMRERCYVKNSEAGPGFRIKTIRLRGVYSQGILCPLKEIAHYFKKAPKVGDDVTDLLNVKKYEKKLDEVARARLGGNARGAFPSFIPKTDEHRIQNFFGRFEKEYSDHVWEVSLKMDGSSMTAYFNGVKHVKDTWFERTKRKVKLFLGMKIDAGPFGVCSRNIDLTETSGNAFWTAARKTGLEEKLKSFYLETGRSIAVQGELVGPGIQGNFEVMPENELFIFNIWDIDRQTYFTSEERTEFLKANDLKGVPVYDVRTFESFAVEDFLALAETGFNGGKSINAKYREGLVFKSLSDPKVSFKAISNKYLLKEKD
jgi:RNA ligase (TIGR02306 family)